MSLLADFHLLRPLWLLALLPMPLILWWLIRYHARHSDWEQACDPHLLHHLLVPSSTSGSRSGFWLLATVWLLAVLALSGPSWERYPHTLYQPPEAQVLVLSLDRSMLAEDLHPSRLERARHKITDLLVPGRQAALVVYAGAAFRVVPLTHDSATIRHLLGVLEPELMPAPGSRPEHGLQLAGELLAQAGVSSGHIILLADQGSAAATATARRLATHGHRVSVLAVGTPHSAPLPATRDGAERQLAPFDETGLQAIARMGSGIYTRLLADNRDVQALLAAAPGGERRTEGGESATALRWLDRGPWLVALLVPLAALGFRRGWLSVLLVAVLLPPQVQAGSWSYPSWQDWWWRSDQQDYHRREGLYGDWLRAEQAYRAGDFAAAAEKFVKLPGALGHYNRGNALVGLGELHAALAAYDAALTLEPDFTAARENRARVLAQLQQQTAAAPSDSKGGNPDETATSGEASNGDEPDGNGDDRTGERDSAMADAGENGSQADPDARATGEDSAEGSADGSAPIEIELPNFDHAADLWEQQQALEQRLRRVPDDPGGLLRRKFLYQYRERQDG